MAGIGPPPNPNARRRNARPAALRLPAEGRKGKAPRWPLPEDVVLKARLELTVSRLEVARWKLEEAEEEGKPTAGLVRKVEACEEREAELRAKLKEQRRLEAALWRDLWKLPQAIGWEQMSWLREVAQYVRWKVLAELGDLDASKEARQLADRIGLTPWSLLRLRWEIDAPAEPVEQAVSSDNVTPIDQYRELYG